MKKGFLLLLTALLLLSVSLEAQTIVLNESFEDGIPTTWTQENVVGSQMWAVETDGAYPDGALTGSKRAYLRNGTNQTIGYKTRLVTPVLDLTGVYQPILKFGYAIPKWTGDFDTLRIWYKSDSNTDWKLVKEYTSAVNKWQMDMVTLPAVSATYQIAFEGTDNMGRGILLDSVQVRSMPECTTPHNLNVFNMIDGGATFQWQASLDANFFQILLTTKVIDPDTLDRVDDEYIAMNYNMEADSVSYRVNNLTSGQYYWLYIRSLCENENSEWGSYNFRMNPTVTIPYSENFNVKYVPSRVTRQAAWTYGSNFGCEPYIPTNLAPKTVALERYSKDSTFCLVFAGSTTPTTAIEGGNYSYAVCPEILGTDLKDCELHFYSTVYTYTGRNNGSGIIVGIMTDPEDLNTFVPIDTCRVYDVRSFQENLVSFEKYTGNGHFICFLSRFDKKNRIYIDDVSVVKRADLGRVCASDIYIAPTDTTVAISWPVTRGATAYNVMITNKPVADPTTAMGDDVVTKQTVEVASFSFAGLEPKRNWNVPYYVYVQAINSSTRSEWSFYKPFVTTGTGMIPQSFPMENTEESYTLYNVGSVTYPTSVSVFGNNATETAIRPYFSTSYSHGTGATSLGLTKTGGCDAWAVLPRISNEYIKDLELSFFMLGGSSYSNTRLAVGVMTNPMDINTLDVLQIFTISHASFARMYANFADYKGTGEYIAFSWLDAPEGLVSNMAMIDDVILKIADGCLQPAGFKANATESTIDVSWNASGALTWDVLVSDKYLSEDDLDREDFTETTSYVKLLTTVETTPAIHLENLEPATPYYCYARTVCTGTKSVWSQPMVVTTDCSPLKQTPYFEDFSKYGDGIGSFPKCWSGDFEFSYSSAGTHYPYISTGQNHSGLNSGSLDLYSYSDSYASCAVAPLLDVPVNEVRLEFYMLGSTAGNVLYVGVIGNANDYSTFLPLDSLYAKANNVWQKAEVDFSKYTGNAKYIAFSSKLNNPTSGTTNTIYIDDLIFTSGTCLKPVNIHPESAGSNSVTLIWEGRTTDKWEVVISRKEATVIGDTLEGVVEDDFIVRTTTDQNSIFVDELEVSTTYYAYVRPTCGAREWGSADFQTECVHINPRIMYRETFDDVASPTTTTRPYCWTYGNSMSTSTTYIPYINKQTSYSSSKYNVLRLYGASNYYPSWACMPKIDIDDLSKLIVSFTAAYSSASSIIFGVMTDPDDVKTFVALDSISVGSVITEFVYDMADFAQEVKGASYIAFRTPIKKAGYAYLDDISIMVSNCPNPKPVVSKVTHNSARVASGLRVSTPWRIILAEEPINIESLSAGSYEFLQNLKGYKDYSLSSTTRNTQLTDLKEHTHYYCAIAAICDSATSLWYARDFTTQCRPMTVENYPMISFEESEGFVAGNALASKDMQCLIIGNKTSATNVTYLPYVITSDTYAHSGNKAMCIASAATVDGTYAILPAVDVDDVSKLQIRFYGYATVPSTSAVYAQKLIVGIITDPTDLATFVPIDTISGKPELKEYLVMFRDYEGDYLGNMGKNICFMSEFGMSNCFYVDDITLEYTPSCPAPTDVVLESTTDFGATFRWNGYAESYRVVLVEDEGMLGTGPYILDTIVKATRLTVDNLQPATQHMVYVQALCSQTDNSTFSRDQVVFHTACPPRFDVPYMCNFDQNSKLGLGAAPDCWSGEYLNSTLVDYPAVMPDCGHGGKRNALMLFSAFYAETKTVAVLPDLNVDDLSRYVIGFYAAKTDPAASYGGALIVGYIPANGNAKSFQPIDTILINSASYHKYYVDLSAYQSELIGAHLAFMADAKIQELPYCSIYIDEVSVAPAPSCYEPEIVSVETSQFELKVNIEAGDPTQTKWQIALVEASLMTENANLETVATIKTVTEETATFTSLRSGTKYLVFARSMCSDSNLSAWTETDPVYTEYYYKDSYSFGFEKTEDWVRSPLSNTDHAYIHPALKSGTGTGASYKFYAYATQNDNVGTYASTGEGALRLYTTSSGTGAYVIFPALAEPKDRSFSFDVRPGYANPNNTLMAMAGPDNEFVIGTVEKGKGIETFTRIAAVSLPAYTTASAVNAENNYLFQHLAINIDENTLKTRQIAIMDIKDASTCVYFDNVRMDAAVSYPSPIIKSFIVADVYADIKFVNDAPKTIYIFNGKDKTLESATPLVTMEHVGLSAHITGLTALSDYTMIVVTEGAENEKTIITSSSQNFTTYDTAKELDENNRCIWNFDDDLVNLPESSTEQLPSGWRRGPATSIGSWTVQKSGYNHTATPPTASASMNNMVYGINGSNALRSYVPTAQYAGNYVILPLVNCDFETMQLTIFMRSFPSNTAGIIPTNGPNTPHTGGIIVGTCTNPYDFTTFTPIDTINYPSVNVQINSTLMSTDPNGRDYWHKATLPLAGTEGRFIAIMYAESNFMFLDDITIEPKTTIVSPRGLNISSATTSTITFRWYREWQPTLKTIVRLYDRDKTTLLQCDTIEPGIKRHTFTGLEDNREYYCSVAQTDGINSSDESSKVLGITDCHAIDINYTTSFENGSDTRQIAGQTNANYQQTKCWTYDAIYNQNAWTTNYPYNVYSSSTALYGHSGQNAVKLFASSVIQSYIVSPSLGDMDMDTIQIEFWGLPGYRKNTGVMNATTYIGTTYSKSVEVGTCADPNDLESYKPIRICTYSLPDFTTSTEANEDNNFLFEHFIVPLKGAVGKYVYFKASFTMNDGVTRANSMMYIDDISFSRYVECPTPNDIQQVGSGVDYVDAEWIAKTELCLVQVATSGRFNTSEIIATDTVVSSAGKVNFRINNLAPGKSYYVRVAGMCEDGNSNWSNAIVMYTIGTPYWMEDFRNEALSNDWSFGTTYAKDLFNDQTGNLRITGFNAASYGWNRTPNNYGIIGPHFYTPFYRSGSTDAYDHMWMITPAFYLEPDKKAQLTWTMARTLMVSGYTPSSSAPTANAMDDSQVFMIVISEDGGYTWKRENATIWTNGNDYGTAEFTMNSIPATEKQYTLDLSKYASKSIKIGFYRETQSIKSPSQGIHIGAVRINYYDLFYLNPTLCHYEDAEAYGLYINGDEITTPVAMAERFVLAPEVDDKALQVNDTVYRLEVNYLPVPRTNSSVTICEGRNWTEGSFAPISKAGVYNRKLVAANGCDSVVTIYVDATPAVQYNEEHTLCPGETYEWNGKILNRSGLYRDTTTSLVTGCDSISSLVLTYLNAGDTLTKEVIITEDDLPYSYESITYPVGTKPGVYTDTIYVQSGECKGVLIHKLTINVGSDLEEIIDINALQSGVHKVLIREQLYIVRDGKWYDALGKSVQCPL